MILFPLIAALAAATASAAPPCPAAMDSAASLCRAVAASDAQHFAEAAGEFERAAAASPVGDPLTQRILAAAGNMWIAAGQPGKAALALDRALVGNGLQADQRGLALLDRARAAEAQNDLAGARRFVTAAGESASKDGFYWYFSAALSLREGNLGAARSSIDRALALGSDDPDILFEAGHIAEAQGDAAKARDYWQKALTNDPGGETGLAAQKALGLAAAPTDTSATPAPVKTP